MTPPLKMKEKCTFLKKDHKTPCHISISPEITKFPFPYTIGHWHEKSKHTKFFKINSK